MRVLGAVALLLCGIIPGCGSAAGGHDDDPDAGADAAADAVSEVDCDDVTPAVIITTAGGEYAPSSATINRCEVVELRLTAGHTATSLTGDFYVGQGEDRCFRFATTGTYGLYCQVHGFTGELIVE